MSAWRDTARSARSRLSALWPPRACHAAALFAAGVASLGLYGLVFYATLPGRLPSALDWRSAAALLARDALPGDAVALDPWCAERARAVLPASLPVMAFPRFVEQDLVGVQRVWLIALTSAPRRRLGVARDLAERARTTAGPQRLGNLEITRYDLRAPELPLAFLPDRVATASVSAGGLPCTADALGRYRCPVPYAEVVREVREVDFLPRPCLFAHPSSDLRAPLTITFPDVPLGHALRGHTGIVGEAAYYGEAPVTLSVSIDGRAIGDAVEPPRTLGWHPFQLDTSHDAGRSATVTFTVATADASRRHFCFDAYTVP